MIHSLNIVYALLARDVNVIKKNFVNDLINTLVIVLFYEFIFGYMGSSIGVAPHASFNVFVGNLGILILFLSYGRAFTDLFDVHRTGFFDYKRTVPLSFNWLLLSYLLSYVMNYLMMLTPLFIIGKIVLGPKLSFALTNWPLFFGVVLMGMFFTAALYLNFVFRVSIQFFSVDYWQRVHGPLFLLGCSFFTFKPAAAYSSILSKILLLNPFTYINEGMRSTLSGSDTYLSASLCFTVLSALTILNLIVLFGFTKKRLDVV